MLKKRPFFPNYVVYVLAYYSRPSHNRITIDISFDCDLSSEENEAGRLDQRLDTIEKTPYIYWQFQHTHIGKLLL